MPLEISKGDLFHFRIRFFFTKHHKEVNYNRPNYNRNHKSQKQFHIAYHLDIQRPIRPKAPVEPIIALANPEAATTFQSIPLETTKFCIPTDNPAHNSTGNICANPWR
jgi:hypothetical protein